MRLLFDQNLSDRLCRRLADLFPDSTQVRLCGLDRASDAAVWRHAHDNGLVIVTLDADFADLAAVWGAPPKVVWLRCGNQPTTAIEELVRRHAGVLAQFDQDAEAVCLEVYG